VNVLFTSVEAAPFAKVGGMADVVGSLPAALRRLGVDARVVMPGTGSIPHQKYNITHRFGFKFAHRGGVSEVQVYGTEWKGVPVYFVQAWPYLGQERSVYQDVSQDYPRFIFFSQVVQAVAWQLREREGWFPDVLHAHDWHTGLVPFLLTASRWQADWRGVGSLMTLHNMAYQGDWAGSFLYNAGIPPRLDPLLWQGNKDNNLLAMGILYADYVTTVSPRYAIEIQYPENAFGLDHLVRARLPDLRGILNGIDVEDWNPATDRVIAQNYDVDTVELHRPANKAALQQRLGLPVRPEVPLLGVVSRLTGQKGIDLLIPAVRGLLSTHDVQFVALGSGEDALEYGLWGVQNDFGGRARFVNTYSDDLAHLIYAGSDIFLMPSRFEPCGTSQMFAMRYGSLPLVRETGGLADTVQNYDDGAGDSGTGFTFLWSEPYPLYNTMRWAVETYFTRKEAWRRMVRRAMLRDFSWDTSARHYVDLYHQAAARHR
jgi:starch synthase